MIRGLKLVNALVAAILAAVVLIYPPVRAFFNLGDAALWKPGIPQAANRLAQNLTPKYAAWAHQRVAGARAEKLATNDISGTEWPLFGSVFYLWAVENLQTAWDSGDHSFGTEPRVYCKDAVIAASELVIAPGQAAWVKKHWGEDYLHRQNVFYRMLVIASLTSREKLLHDGTHLDLLKDQVDSFTRELSASPTGLLEDYPGQCYPGDVMAAVLCIKRADAVLGTDHSDFVTRAVRGFTGPRATRRQLPPYSASAKSGLPTSDARGCGNSYMCLLAPELWPPQSRAWYEAYDKLFWQQRYTAAGYREFATDVADSFFSFDVDAGPVIAGFGVSASSFGVGAARKNGRFDRAYPLAAEMLTMAWEMPNGSLAVPRLLSNFSDAPYLGEAGILWVLTMQPEKGFQIKTAGSAPTFVYLAIFIPLLLGIFWVVDSLYRFKLARKDDASEVQAPALQFGIWLCLMLGAGWIYFTHSGWWSVLLLIPAFVLPVRKKRPKDDWDLRAKAALRAAGGSVPPEEPEKK